MARLKCLLITTLDTDWLSEFSIHSLEKEFDIVKVLRLNRASPPIESFKSELEQLPDFDYLFNFLSPKLVPAWLLAKSKIAAINFHPGSHEYPGIGSASLSIYDQKEFFGVTAHLMSTTIDSGKIIAQRFFPQDVDISCEELFNRGLKECCALLIDIVELIIKNQEFIEVARWSRPPMTRKEFNKWLVIKSLPPSREVNRKVKASRHSTFTGPYIKIGSHIFTYSHSELEE
jgi:methionyl-tRNA formyltransferase